MVPRIWESSLTVMQYLRKDVHHFSEYGTRAGHFICIDESLLCSVSISLSQRIGRNPERMEVFMGPPRTENTTNNPKTCTHSRIIDEARDEDGKNTGQVRCVECGTVFPDLHREAPSNL